MRLSRAAIALALSLTAVLGGVAPASALSGVPGGAQAPSAPQTGGSEFGVPARVLVRPRPIVSRLSVPRSAAAGVPPRATLALEEAGVGTVYVTLVIISVATRRTVLSTVLGWQRTGRTLSVRWPASARLAAGAYRLSVSAHDHRGGTLLRNSHSSGAATFTLAAPAPVAPAPEPSPAPRPSPPPEAGVPTPAQTTAMGAVFPVGGPHNFGGPEDRYGAPRATHVHEGQDVLTAEGTPVLAPLAGTISSTNYQAGAAGYYVVEHSTAGFDFMFAHCQAGTFAVGSGQSVAAGAPLCHAGQTGDATAPHLHFEMWVGGWWAPGGHTIDPLPYLEAWEHG
ncbi:MAG TPA: M23 family metallopeptidase [Solirubrobacteraceae bacterium]